ncbi:MAG TPA: hypothetical protein VGR72_02650 [Candidatus Acidoferrales bacterium]|nr:hypothetical protein [Candidatus Acidoferrales bacterium]
MIRKTSPFIFVAFSFAYCFSALCFTASASAQDYKAAASNSPAPAELSADVRATLADGSINVTGPSGPYCEIWLRKDIPAAASPNAALGVTYGTLGGGSLFGAIHFDRDVKDFRNQSIKLGTYTLRYGLQPVDGNHQGVSDYRDYFLLGPPSSDTSTANLADNDMYAMSRKASGAGHPSVWSLVPADSAPASLPGVVHDTSNNFWVVYFKTPGGVKMGLIVFGHAEQP